MTTHPPFGTPIQPVSKHVNPSKDIWVPHTSQDGKTGIFELNTRTGQLRTCRPGYY